jgi:hypothetical protein
VARKDLQSTTSNYATNGRRSFPLVERGKGRWFLVSGVKSMKNDLTLKEKA